MAAIGVYEFIGDTAEARGGFKHRAILAIVAWKAGPLHNGRVRCGADVLLCVWARAHARRSTC